MNFIKKNIYAIVVTAVAVIALVAMLSVIISHGAAGADVGDTGDTGNALNTGNTVTETPVPTLTYSEGELYNVTGRVTKALNVDNQIRLYVVWNNNTFNDITLQTPAVIKSADESIAIDIIEARPESINVNSFKDSVLVSYITEAVPSSVPAGQYYLATDYTADGVTASTQKLFFYLDNNVIFITPGPIKSQPTPRPIIVPAPTASPGPDDFLQDKSFNFDASALDYLNASVEYINDNFSGELVAVTVDENGVPQAFYLRLKNNTNANVKLYGSAYADIGFKEGEMIDGGTVDLDAGWIKPGQSAVITLPAVKTLESVWVSYLISTEKGPITFEYNIPQDKAGQPMPGIIVQ